MTHLITPTLISFLCQTISSGQTQLFYDTGFQNLIGLGFDIWSSLDVKCNGAVRLSVYNFLVVFMK